MQGNLPYGPRLPHTSSPPGQLAVGKRECAAVDDHLESRPYVDLKFRGGGELRTLVDSGAARCLVRRSAFLSLCALSSRMPLLTPTCPLFSANGGTIRVLGEASLQLEGGIAWNWVVVEGISQDALLGADLMKAHQTTLDWVGDQLSMGGIAYPLYYEREPRVGMVDIQFPLEQLLSEFNHVFYQEGQPSRSADWSP
jgi:hypothetical protein